MKFNMVFVATSVVVLSLFVYKVKSYKCNRVLKVMPRLTYTASAAAASKGSS